VLTSGPLPQNPGRLVESLRLRQVLQELGRTYAMVIIDAPPVLAVADAVALARATKGTLLVVEAGVTTRRMLLDLRQRLDTAGIEPIGAVLAKVDVRDGGYGYYRAYKELYARRDVPPDAAAGGAP
jgi:Mrp family chromosome partitioning ATPase